MCCIEHFVHLHSLIIVIALKEGIVVTISKLRKLRLNKVKCLPRITDL